MKIHFWNQFQGTVLRFIYKKYIYLHAQNLSIQIFFDNFQAVCKVLSNPNESGKVLLKSIFKGVSIYFNYTGSAKCLDFTDGAVGQLGVADGWDFQVTI